MPCACAGVLGAGLCDIAIVQRGEVEVRDMQLRRFAVIDRQDHASDDGNPAHKSFGLRGTVPCQICSMLKPWVLTGKCQGGRAGYMDASAVFACKRHGHPGFIFTSLQLCHLALHDHSVTRHIGRLQFEPEVPQATARASPITQVARAQATAGENIHEDIGHRGGFGCGHIVMYVGKILCRQRQIGRAHV